MTHRAIPTLPSPIPYRPRSHPVIPAELPAIVEPTFTLAGSAFFRCGSCRCAVESNHIPRSEDCEAARVERLHSIRS